MDHGDERPQNADAQLIEFAASGRLFDLDPRRAVETADKTSTVLAMVLSSVALGVGLSVSVFGARASSTAAALLGVAVVTVSLALLLPTIRLVRLHTASQGVQARPGAVLPPELLRTGMWVHRRGHWSRIEQIGQDGSRHLTALLSSGEVIELVQPMTVAGGSFRAVADPVADLRR